MPSKSKKVASRQASLRARKKRGKSAPQVFQAAPTSRKLHDLDDAAPAATASATPEPSGSPQSQRAPRLSRRARQSAAEAVSTYPYMGAELRHIALVTTAIFVIIAILTFVLR